MDAFIYLPRGLAVGLDEIEDLLDEAFGELGEVTGSGLGEMGSNLDVSIVDGAMSVEQALQKIRHVLTKITPPQSATVVIDGDSFAIG